MNREEMAEKILKHLEDGGHISEGNSLGFSSWNVDKWPLPAHRLYSTIKRVQGILGKIIRDLDSKANLRPFPPFREHQEIDLDTLRMENDLPNYNVLIQTLLGNIEEDLVILDRWINGELIE